MLARFLAASLALLVVTQSASAQADPAKPQPVPRLEANVPTAAVTALAFGPDGKTLYAGGFDKVVRVWKFDADNSTFVPDPAAALRVPIGPGRTGTINVLAVSPDGTRLAAAGLGDFRGATTFGARGRIAHPSVLTAEQMQDIAQIHIFDTRTKAVSLLRGHEELVQDMMFAPPAEGRAPWLVSVGVRAIERKVPPDGRMILWNVDKSSIPDGKGGLTDRGAKLDELKLNDLKLSLGPALAVRNAGADVRVALAWGDGILRSWQAGAEYKANEGGKSAANLTRTVAYLPDGRLLTGGLQGGSGYLQLWRDPSGQAPSAIARLTIAPLEGHKWAVPVAIRLVASPGGTGHDHAVVLARMSSPDNGAAPARYGIYLFPLPAANDNDLKPPMLAAYNLGVHETPPVMATSPDGHLLAVTRDRRLDLRAYDPHQTITIYDSKGLFETGKPLTELQSAELFNTVAFLGKGKEAVGGLLLSKVQKANPGDKAQPRKEDLALDFVRRTTTADPTANGWQVIGPADWKATHIMGGTFNWKGPNQTSGEVKLPLKPTREVTDFTMLPPQKPINRPILAVATWDAIEAEPVLTLYAVDPQAPGGAIALRSCNGHSHRIHSIAASPDGRLLVSTAEDQTVCIWSLTDLDKTWGQRATVLGPILDQSGGDTVVRDIERGSPADGKLQKRDIIGAFLRGEKRDVVKPIASPGEFFAALWRDKPGEQVSVRLTRAGKETVVALPLSQGRDEQKPLVTLFIKPGQPTQWLAWTPTGPYDYYGKEIERHLGWHFNPVRPGEPARFAPVEEYRAESFKEGLLRRLIETGNLANAIGALLPDPIPEPVIDVQVVEVVRQPQADVSVTIVNLVRSEIGSLTYRLDNGDEKSLSLDNAAGRVVANTIPLPAGAGKAYRLQVRVTTKEKEPKTATRDVTFRYQPAAPTIVLTAPKLADEVVQPDQYVEAAAYPLRGEVKPAGGSDISATLWLRGKEVKALGNSFDETLKLEDGRNEIRIVAVNKGAMAGHEDAETTELRWVVHFNRPKAPRIAVTCIASVEPNPSKAEPGAVAVVGTPQVKIAGKITSEDKENLSIARLGAQALQGFKPGTVKEFEFEEVVDLKPDAPGAKPGPGQEVRLAAGTANSKIVDSVLRVSFRPALPKVMRGQLPNPDSDVFAAETDLQVGFEPAQGLTGDLGKFTVSVRVFNGNKPVPQDGGEVIEIASDKLAAPMMGENVLVLMRKVRLAPGDNRLVLQVRNDWRTGSPVEWHVFLRRPPIIASVEASDPKATRFTDLKATVQSALPLTEVRIDMQPEGQPSAVAWQGPPDKLEAKKESENDGIVTWSLLAKQLPVRDGKSVVRLSAANADGICLKPGESVVVAKPLVMKQPPTVKVDGVPDAIKELEYTVPFRALAYRSKLRQVALYRGQDELIETIENQGQDAGDGSFALESQFKPVSLVKGLNRFRVVAIDQDGQRGEALVELGFTPPPVDFEILTRPKDEVPNPVYRIRSRFTWTDPADEARVDEAMLGLRAYVNGFPTRARPEDIKKGKGSREFTLPITLDQRTNHIKLFFDVVVDDSAKREMVLSCTRPSRVSRRLHLIVFVAEPTLTEEARQAFIKRLFDGLKLTPPQVGVSEAVRSANFNEVRMHPYDKKHPIQILTRESGVGRLQLRHLCDVLQDEREGVVRPDDVTLIYWIGRELRNDEDKRDRWLPFHPDVGKGVPPSEFTAIPLQRLLQVVQCSPGAGALLMDVATRQPPPQLGRAHGSVLRYATEGDQPALGVLGALQEVTNFRQAVSLGDVADQLRYAKGVIPPELADLLGPGRGLVIVFNQK